MSAAAADAEASWGTGAATFSANPFWPLTQFEERYVELLCGTGLDAHAAWLMVLDYRCRWTESPFWPDLKPFEPLIRKEWQAWVGYDPSVPVPGFPPAKEGS